MKAYHVDVSLKDAGKTLAGIKLISACFIIVQKEKNLDPLEEKPVYIFSPD